MANYIFLSDFQLEARQLVQILDVAAAGDDVGDDDDDDDNSKDADSGIVTQTGRGGFKGFQMHTIGQGQEMLSNAIW